MATAEKTVPFPARTEVRICFRENEVTVDPPVCFISVEKNESIQWVADGDFDFFVCFDHDTPFQSHHFHAGSQEAPLLRKGVAYGRYKYSVEVNGKILDPDVIVQR